MKTYEQMTADVLRRAAAYIGATLEIEAEKAPFTVRLVLPQM